VFETWIRSDLESPAAARRARLLNAFALWFLLALAGLVIVALVAARETSTPLDGRLGLVAGSVTAGITLAYVFSRQGALHLAVAVLETVLNVMLLVLLGALGTTGPVLALVPLVVLATALLWSLHASVWLALAWSVTYLVVALAELGGFEPPLSHLKQAIPAALTISLTVMGFGLSGVLAWLWVAGAPGNAIDPYAASETRPATEKDQPAEEDELAQEESQAVLASERVERANKDIGGKQLPSVEPPESQPPPRAPIPVVDLFRGTVVLPVSGELDAELGAQLFSDLLQGIVEHDARFVLLDVSHVPVIREAAAHSLGRAVAGAGLMGAEVGLVGIGPRLAAQLVELDVNLRGATAHVDMEAALRYALHRLGRISRPLLATGASLEPPARQLGSGSTTDP
jgi:anti-anti-sigma regulatory factor